MKLPKGFVFNVPVTLDPDAGNPMVKLELVEVDCTAADLTNLLHRDFLVKSAGKLDLADEYPQELTINSVRYKTTSTSVYDWFLLVNTAHDTPFKFMLIPADLIEQKLEQLAGRLPYLECHDGEDGLVHDTGRSEVENRGIELTALMLLQAILPRDVF
jgi:hypothetical protein